MRRASILLITVVILAACQSAPDEIPEGLSQAELIQRAQEASDGENWETATLYYEAVVERFPQDREASVAAQYEIAFIRYKQGQFDLAASGFEGVLAIYDFQEEGLPAWPRVLALKLLGEIESGTLTAEDGEADAQ